MLNPVNPRSMSAPLLNSPWSFGGNQIAPPDSAGEVEDTSPLRVMAFKLGLILVFIRFSIIHQLLTSLVHVNFYLLYLFGIPALLGVALAGGVQRTLRSRPAVYWAGFAIWLAVGAPFSSWRGGSIGGLSSYLRTDFPMLFVTAGLVYTWRECRAMMYAIAWGAVAILFAGKMFQDDTGYYGERLAINFGTVSNSNDYAGHLVLVLPFLLWAALTSKSKAIRLAALCGIPYGVLLVLKTASRGGLVALVAGALFWLLRGSMRQRIALLALGPVVVVALVGFVPRSSMVRILSFSTESADASEEALESSTMRRYLLQESILYTLQHPLFGVGMGQFSNYEGVHSTLVGGLRGFWHETHNTYTQVSSECGIPALALYLAGIVSTFLMLNRVYRRASGRPDCVDIRNAAFCIMLAMTAYCTATAFLNFAYFFYLPAIASLAIAVSNAAQVEFDRRSSQEPQPGFMPPYRRPLPRAPVTPAAR